MAGYLRNLWLALRDMPGHMVIRNAAFDENCAYVLDLEARLAAFERRSQAGKRSHETRKAKKVGFQIADTGSF